MKHTQDLNREYHRRTAQCVLDSAEGKEEVASVQWMKDPTQETKAKVQPYVDKVLAIFEKVKKAQKIEKEIHILNRDMETHMDTHCRMNWFNEGRCVMASGTDMAPFCQVNVPYVVQ